MSPIRRGEKNYVIFSYMPLFYKMFGTKDDAKGYMIDRDKYSIRDSFVLK